MHEFRRARSEDIDAIARIHVAGWRNNYRGMMPDDLLDSRTFEFRQTMWRDLLAEPARTTLVAIDDVGQVCGFASAFTLDEPHAGFDAFLQMLYVDESIKRGGVGRALLGAIARAMLDAGRRSMALRTLRRNPARGFYERLGARLLSALDIDEGPLDDVAYGFDDLSLVAQAPTRF